MNPTANTHAQFDLYFTEGQELYMTVFHDQQGKKRTSVRGNDEGAYPSYYGSFPWRKGARAVSVLALREAARTLRHQFDKAVIDGPLAHCLDQGIKKKSLWLKEMFGEPAFLIRRSNPGRKRGGPVVLSFANELSGGSIKVFVGPCQESAVRESDPEVVERLVQSLLEDRHRKAPIEEQSDCRLPSKNKNNVAQPTVGVFGVALRVNRNGQVEVFCNVVGTNQTLYRNAAGIRASWSGKIVDLPGGGLKLRDRGIQHALEREFRVETGGCKVTTIGAPIGPFEGINQITHRRDMAFAYRVSFTGRPRQNREASSHCWVPVIELRRQRMFRLPGKGIKSRLGEMILALVSKCGLNGKA